MISDDAAATAATMTAGQPDQIPHLCGLSNECPACDADFDATPAGILTRAIKVLDDPLTCWPLRFKKALGDLLQNMADDMSDEKAAEKEFPEHIPTARWQVVDEPYGGGWRHHYDWDAGLAVARAVLHEPDPNDPDAAEAPAGWKVDDGAASA